MAVGKWILIGGFLGAICGFVFGAGDVLIHYHYPYNPHFEMYPLPIAIGTMGSGDAMLSIIPGAIAGGIIGVRIRSAQDRHREINRERTSNPGVWPPPPTPPAI